MADIKRVIAKRAPHSPNAGESASKATPINGKAVYVDSIEEAEKLIGCSVLAWDPLDIQEGNETATKTKDGKLREGHSWTNVQFDQSVCFVSKNGTFVAMEPNNFREPNTVRINLFRYK